MKFDVSKSSIEEIIRCASFEYETKGRSELFMQIERDLIEEGDITKLSEFAQWTKGVNLKAIEYCVINSAISYPNVYFDLAYYIEGVNVAALEDRLIKCKSELNVVDYFSHIVRFARYIKNSDVNKLIREIIDYPLNDNINIHMKIELCAQIASCRKDVDIDMLSRFLDIAKKHIRLKDDNKLQRQIDKIKLKRNLDNGLTQ